MADKKKIDKKESLLPSNPLLDTPIVTVVDETGQKIEAIEEIESLIEINRQQLAVKRQQMELIVDNKKLDTAKKTVEIIEQVVEAAGNEAALARVVDSIKTAQDLKWMAEAAEKLSRTLDNLMHPNSMDALGTRRRQKINFMFKSSGPVQAAVQIDTGKD